MNHWTKHLPEFGTDRYAIGAAEIDARITSLETQLTSARAARESLEEESMRWARRHWSANEILEAMNAANS